MRFAFPLSIALLLIPAAGCSDAASETTTSSSVGATTGAGGSGGSGTGGSGGSGGAAAAHLTPDTQFLPKASGTCPEFAEGKATFSADGNARNVQLWLSDAATTLDGPLVFFFHGAGGMPTEATYALGTAAMKAIKEQGGIVAAPFSDNAAGQFEWFLINGEKEDDLRVMDEVVACAIEKLGIDQRRIHVVGFSAGAMNTMEVGWRRSGYVASLVSYSGADLGMPPDQDPANKFPAMVFHGGPKDQVIINFADGTVEYREKMTAAGHFTVLCAHGKGHTLPPDARASSWQFLQDHPFGTTPSPYVAGLPTGFPAYCGL